MNLSELEASFQMYSQDLSRWIPDGIQEIDLRVLQRLGLLNITSDQSSDSLLTRYFQVVETPEKITLFNDNFVIWIVPDVVDHIPTTFALVALREEDDLEMELAFSTTGVYNTSRMVLRILEKMLAEVQDTENELARII